MNAIFSMVKRDRKPVILGAIKYGAKLSTTATTRRSLSPFARFCLQMIAVLVLGLAVLAIAVLASETVAAACAGVVLLALAAAMMKGGTL